MWNVESPPENQRINMCENPECKCENCVCDPCDCSVEKPCGCNDLIDMAQSTEDLVTAIQKG